MNERPRGKKQEGGNFGLRACLDCIHFSALPATDGGNGAGTEACQSTSPAG